MSMSKRAGAEVGMAGAAAMLAGSILATTGSETGLILAGILALVGVVLFGVGLGIAGHPSVIAQQKSDRVPDELNAF